eukprot:PhM_4_TR7094/c0_g1_i1/m.1846
MRTGLLLLSFVVCTALAATDANNENWKCNSDLVTVASVEANLRSAGTDPDSLFCWSWIQRYRNPDDTTGPMVCTRNGGTAASVLEADAAALAHYQQFKGERMEYPRVFGLKGDDVTDTTDRFGTSIPSGSNVPPNWCASYMQAFVCHIAFPQGVGAATSRNVRPVCFDSCEYMMRSCNRHQPRLTQLKSDYRPEWITSADSQKCHEDNPLRNPTYCKLWNHGCGPLAGRAGVSVTDDGDVSSGRCVDFNGAVSTMMSSVLIGFVVIIMVVLL